MDKKLFSYVFIAYVVFLTIYTYKNGEYIKDVIANNGLQGVIYYFFTNPAYVLLVISIFMLNREIGFVRNVIASFLVIYSADILSYPRLGIEMTTDKNLLASSDAIVINKLLEMGITYSNVYFLYYLILPIALLIIALWVLGINDFYKRLIGK